MSQSLHFLINILEILWLAYFNPFGWNNQAWHLLTNRYAHYLHLWIVYTFILTILFVGGVNWFLGMIFSFPRVHDEVSE